MVSNAAVASGVAIARAMSATSAQTRANAARPARAVAAAKVVKTVQHKALTSPTTVLKSNQATAARAVAVAVDAAAEAEIARVNVQRSTAKPLPQKPQPSGKPRWPLPSSKV